MTNPTEQNDHLSGELGMCHLVSPSPELKKNVMLAAHDAWAVTDAAQVEISWGFPVFRLAASIAITVLLVYSAIMTDRRSSANWQVASEPVSQCAMSASLFSERNQGTDKQHSRYALDPPCHRRILAAQRHKTLFVG